VLTSEGAAEVPVHGSYNLGDQSIVDELNRVMKRELLPCLLPSMEVLVQAIDSYYKSNRRVFGLRWLCQQERPEVAADQGHADNHDIVSR
jgi:hypothetical protein